MSSDKEHWNRCRFVPSSERGHYESFFQRANHDERPLAFWIRYTIFVPSGGGEPVALRLFDRVAAGDVIATTGETKVINATRPAPCSSYWQSAAERRLA